MHRSYARAVRALTEWLETCGLTQRAVGAKVGVDQSTIAQWKSGRARPELSGAVALEVASEGRVRVEWWGYEVGALLELARSPWRAATGKVAAQQPEAAP